MKKGRSTYTFKINNNLNQLNELVNQFITANNFVKEETNGETYYKSGDAMIGYKYFNYIINGDNLTIYAWLKNFSTDVEIEQEGLTSLNMSVMNYRNLLGTLFTEIDRLNNTVPTNPSVVNIQNANNTTNNNQNTTQSVYTTPSNIQNNINNTQGTYQNDMNTNITGYNPQTGEPIYANQSVNTFQNTNTKKQETMCEIAFWASIVGLFAALGGVSWGIIVYIIIFYFASQGLKTPKKNKAIASIIITIISILIVILTLMSN